MAGILALIQEVVGDSLVHYALSPDEGAALGHELAIILIVLPRIADELAIRYYLLGRADVDVVGHQVVWDCRAELILGLLARLAEARLDRVVRWAIIVQLGRLMPATTLRVILSLR